MIESHILGNKISSNTREAFSLNDKSRFGERKGEKIEYSPVEALFLVSESKMSVSSGKKSLSFEQLLKKFSKSDKKLETKLAVFKDLRKKGFIIKAGLKFGAEFRVYERGIRPGEDHARWILYTARESESTNWQDFAARNRIAHSVKKNLLIAIVDEEDDVTYYEVSWIKF